MKAQFATIEALASLFMALSTAAVASAMLSSYSISYGSDSYNLSIAAAAFDFMNQMSSNALASNCLASYLSTNSACMYNYTSQYERIYLIRKISVITEQNKYANYTKIFCRTLTGTGLICIGVD